LGEVNPTEISEQLEAPPAEVSPEELAVLAEEPAAVALSPSPLNPPWLRLAYALEFLIGLIAIITTWSEIGGEGHLDLMPWYVKLACILGLDWCLIRFTASLVEQQRVWTGRTVGWLLGILLFGLLMGGITYYYHLHEEPDDRDEDTTAAAVNINYLGTFFYHGNKRIFSSFPIRFLAGARVREGDRIPGGSDGRDSCVRL
jgi:hypothetical protein